MILLRGIKGEEYARKIEKGIVDCRDILSALLEPPVTGYEYSDYYEKNLVKALMYFSKHMFKREIKDIHDPIFLNSLLIDYYVPYIYLTYFHVLNEQSLEWLKNFDDDCVFIAIEAKIDRITRTVIGNEYFGSRMSYVDSINELNQNNCLNANAACMCSIENTFDDKINMSIPLQIYNTLAFPLLCRERDERFTDIENEFRIIAFDCPRFRAGVMKQISRDAVITTLDGIKYKGTLTPGENTDFKSDILAIGDSCKSLSEIIDESQGQVTLNSRFKSIDIRDIAADYRYIGGKTACERFINEMLIRKPREIFVNRTIMKSYRKDELTNVMYAPGHQDVEY